MRLGLQSFSLHLAFGLHPDCMHYPDKLSLEGCLAKAREWGFAAVQIDPIHLTDRSPGYLERIRALAHGLGLMLELGILGFDLAGLRPELEVASALGVRFVRVFDSICRRLNDPRQVEERLEGIARSIKAVLPELEERGIVLGWENHVDYTTTEQLGLLQRFENPYFRSCMDIGNVIAFREDPLESARRLASYAGGVHLKDYGVRASPSGVLFHGMPLGEGLLPLKGILEVLERETQIEHLVYEQSVPPINEDPGESVRHEEEVLVKSLKYAERELGLEVLQPA